MHRLASTSVLRRRRSARVSVTVVIAIVALVAGTVGGFGLSNWLSTASPGAAADVTAAGDDEQWYTCGMHPNVLQKGPGECCH